MNNRLIPLLSQLNITLAQGALLFDFDHVLHYPNLSDPNNKDSYIVDATGMLYGELINETLLRKLFSLLDQENFAYYVITARPPTHREYVFNLLSKVSNIKIENIRCLGVEVYCETRKRPQIASLTHPKVNEVQLIHQTELAHLPKSHVGYSDDDQHNVDPVAAAEYVTFFSKANRNEEHLHQMIAFVKFKASIKHVTTLGNYAVLGTPAELQSQPLDRTEFFAPAESKGIEGKIWRLRTVIDFAHLARACMGDADKKQLMSEHMSQEPQKILFTQDEKSIRQHVIDKSFGTVKSFEELAEKDLVILLGSEGKRKAGPLLKAIARLFMKNIAVIGLPAESGVDTQPNGHEQTLQGDQNRLDQLKLFRETLTNLLGKISNSKPNIACLAVENGVGLLPVDEIKNDSEVVLASAPLKTADQALFCFYDQAHILLDLQGKQHYYVTKPAQVHYTLVNEDADALAALNNDAIQYYQVQSQWSHEMKKRMNDASLGSPYPVRTEGEKIYSTDDLIQGELENILSIHAIACRQEILCLKGNNFGVFQPNNKQEEQGCVMRRGFGSSS